MNDQESFIPSRKKCEEVVNQIQNILFDNNLNVYETEVILNMLYVETTLSISQYLNSDILDQRLRKLKECILMIYEIKNKKI